MQTRRIEKITAREIIDSRGNPTVAATVTLSDGTAACASVPSGASTGSYEACELRDIADKRFGGRGVLQAVENINDIIAPHLIALETINQGVIDRAMISLDGTQNLSSLGANAVLAVSLAVAKAAAKSYKLPLYSYLGGISAKTLPVPMMNILNGGAHADNNIDIQEFMIIPLGFKSFKEGLRACCEVYHILGALLKGRGLTKTVGDEGGFAPQLENEEEALKLIVEAIGKAGYSTDKIKLALDAAANEWGKADGCYLMPKSKREFKRSELISHWEELCGKYPIISLEDGLGENDFEGWTELTSRLGGKVQLVGDDLFVTNPKRLEKGISLGAANAILIKPNQIGTLTQVLSAVSIAKKAGYRTIISHRSGETEDVTIADIAVGLNAGQIKTGAPCRSERVAKYNRLLVIEENLGKNGIYGEK